MTSGKRPYTLVLKIIGVALGLATILNLTTGDWAMLPSTEFRL